MLINSAAHVESRRILWLLVRRDLQLRYAGTFLGYLWTFIEPLAMAGTYWFVFTVVLGARNLGESPYVLFLLLGMLPWNWFANSLTGGAKGLTAEAKIVRSTNVPREIWVARVVTGKMFEFLLALPVVVLLIVLFHDQVSLHWQLVFFPLAMVLQFMLGYGFALMLAPITVLADDVVRLVRILLRIGFYLSPVIYGLTDIPQELHNLPINPQTLAALNPMAGIISLYRAGFWPDQEANWIMYGVSVTVTIAVLIIGLTMFRRLEGTVLKEL